MQLEDSLQTQCYTRKFSQSKPSLFLVARKANGGLQPEGSRAGRVSGMSLTIHFTGDITTGRQQLADHTDGILTAPPQLRGPGLIDERSDSTSGTGNVRDEDLRHLVVLEYGHELTIRRSKLSGIIQDNWPGLFKNISHGRPKSDEERGGRSRLKGNRET